MISNLQNNCDCCRQLIWKELSKYLGKKLIKLSSVGKRREHITVTGWIPARELGKLIVIPIRYYLLGMHE